MISEKVRGAGGQTCGMIKRQVLVIGLSLARQQTGKKDKEWFLQPFVILTQQGPKNWRVSGVRACMHVCVYSALWEERTRGSLIEFGIYAERLGFLLEIK